VGPGGQGWHWAEKWGFVGVERREKQVVVLRLVNQLVTPRPIPWPEKREKELRPFLSIPFCEFGFFFSIWLFGSFGIKKFGGNGEARSQHYKRKLSLVIMA
jgi:hypothetical protein